MDNLLAAFESSTRVSFDLFDTYSLHPKFSGYKDKFTKGKQEDRRKEFLNEQKLKKITTINLKRGIDEKVDIEKVEKELIEYTENKFKRKNIFKDVLMLSEWLVDVPQDFEENWIVVPCPVGKRVLIVAEKCYTHCYARKGFKILSRFPSGLPGGAYRSECRFNSYTRLDGIWNEPTKTLYILDALDLGPNIVNCESQFRFKWLDWKLDELKDDITSISKRNRYRIVLLDRFPASHLPEFVNKPIDGEVKMDGLLFFHKDGLYEEYGRSPLVTWLKPYMVPEILGLETHPDYLADKPQQMDIDPVQKQRELAEAKETTPSRES